MKTSLVLTSSNRIEAVESNCENSVGKSIDVTEEVVALVFDFFKSQYDLNTPRGKGWGWGFGDQGTLMYLPKDMQVMRKEDLQKFYSLGETDNV